MHRIKFLNTITPKAVTSAAVSDPIGWPAIYVQPTVDCFICISATGKGTDGVNIPAAGNGHFLTGGSGYTFLDIDPAFKLGTSAGTVHISAIAI